MAGSEAVARAPRHFMCIAFLEILRPVFPCSIILYFVTFYPACQHVPVVMKI